MTEGTSGRPPRDGRRIARRPGLPRDPGARRIGAMLVVFALLFGATGYRLVDLQVVRADEFAARGAKQRARTIELPASRGRLYDREGDVLATSVESATVYADPRAYKATETPEGLQKPPAATASEVAAQLAPIVGRDVAELTAELERDAHFVYVARQLDWELGERIMALDLPGIGRISEPNRVYPAGPLAGQILGFTGIDGDGLYGLELQYDSVLSGSAGELVMEGAPGGLAIASGVRQLEPPVAGTDLVLTIDREIQSAAEAAAMGAIEEFDAAGASVVVLEVGSGDVLAMASAPGFDPNAIQGSDQANWRNRAITDVFEPGSVQKAITAAAAIEEGVVAPTTPMVVDDRIKVGSKVFSDSHEHEPEHIDFAEVIETSSNVGTIEVAQDLGAERLYSYLRRFGYGRQLGVGFPGEASGLLMPVEQWWNTSLPTIAIGQGVAVTLLQAAHAYATIANDGVATQPRVLRGTVGEDGTLTPAPAAEEQRVISDTTARQVREMLARVVSGERGTGKQAQVAGYDVAGKTGTARKPNQGARGYSGQYVASFVGFAPVDEPRIVVAVMVDEPYPIWGGVVAAPLFSEVMEFALKHRKVTPTAPSGSLADALSEAAIAEAIADAKAEGPATAPDSPGSPPVGAAAGGDGGSVAEADAGG